MNTILRLSLLLTHLIVSTTSFSVGSSLLKNKTPSSRRPHEIVLHSTTTDLETKIVAPNQSFRDTQNGELSMVTFNMLAPFYNSLSFENLQQRETFAQQDRQTRVPLAINMAKQANADILCLQEVEGLEHEPILKQLLAEPYSDSIEGYDSLLWTPLLPNRPGDIVGVCVAWRSKKHKVSSFFFALFQVISIHPSIHF
jgi:mRNA deadenylase 3'-5' endonuclease subunit Ccr4